MFNIKYIKTASGQFILFPSSISHDKFENLNPVSAGFVKIYCNEIVCFGESLSLGLKSAPEDSQLATRQYFKKFL